MVVLQLVMGNVILMMDADRSTYNPQVINFPEYTHSISELMGLGNIVHREVNLKYPFYKDMKNRNVSIVPMKGLVDVNDTHNVYLHSKMELPIKEHYNKKNYTDP